MRVSVYIDLFFFFFQAEDGIRDKLVTGVQTCALPICFRRSGSAAGRIGAGGATPRRSSMTLMSDILANILSKYSKRAGRFLATTIMRRGMAPLRQDVVLAADTAAYHGPPEPIRPRPSPQPPPPSSP